MNTHTVTVNGTTFQRKSERTYTHVILVLRDLEKAASYAHGWTREEQKYADENWRFSVDFASGEWSRRHGYAPPPADRIAHEQKIVDGGYDAYIAGLKARKIADHEKRIADGDFNWHASQWCMSEVNATKAARTLAGKSWNKAVRVVAVGVTLEIA